MKWQGRNLVGLVRSMSLKTRVVLMVVLMLVASIWGVALNMTMALERELTQASAANLSAAAGNLAADLDRDVQLRIDALHRLASTLTPQTLADSAKLARLLDDFADVTVIAPAACLIANRSGLIAAGYPEKAVKLGTSVANRDYFREVMAGGKAVVGLPEAVGTARPTVPIAVPLRNDAGTTVGALVGLVLLSDPAILGQLDQMKIGEQGWFILVAPQDRLIVAASDRKRVLTSLPRHGVVPLLDRRLEEGFEKPGITRTSVGVELLTASRRMATTGWVLIASTPAEDVFAPLADLQRRVYLAALLISLAVAAALWLLLTRQLAPLARAGREMRRMSEGEVPLAPIPVTRRDEIGELIAHFNRLVAERSRLDASLRAEIAEREQANAALHDSRDRLEGIYRSVGNGIVSVDEQQRIVLFNAAAERIFGHPAAAMIGQPLGVLIPKRFRMQHESHMRRFGAHGQSARTMGTYGLIYGLRAGGEEFPIEATVSYSGVSPNRIYTVILNDISERLQAEQAREHLTRQLELLTERLTAAQEKERRAIAFELHEELAQELAALKFYLQAQRLGGNQNADTPHADALAVAMHATERVRKLVLDLNPRELDDFGIHAAVETYCAQRAAAGGWAVHLEVAKPESEVPRPVARACFRVLQEALGNVLRHAKANQVWVTLRFRANELELVIRDDGIGFDRSADGDDKLHKGGNIGLFAMQIRAKQVGAHVAIESAVGAGTTVRAVFPLSIGA